MEALSLILQAIVFGSVMMLIIGVIRPGFAVFWDSEKSRITVLKVWGSIAMVTAIIFFILSAQRDDTRKRNDASDPVGGPTSQWVQPAPPRV